MADPTVSASQQDQAGTATAGAVVLTVPAPPAGAFNYLEGILVTAAPGTVAGNSELTVTGFTPAYTAEIVNPIAGGEIYTLIFTKPRRTSQAIVVTLGAMAATSGKVAMIVLAYQQ